MTDDERNAFLAELWRLQAEAGLSDTAMAQRIGISQAYISRLKSGDRGQRFSLNLARRAIAAFPGLSSFLPS